MAVSVRIKFSADLVIEADTMSKAKAKWESMPLFSEEAKSCGVEYSETLLIEDSKTYKDVSNEWDYCDDCDDDEEELDNPAQAVYDSYSEEIRSAVTYVISHLEPEDKTIICAQVDKNFNQRMNPSDGIDDGKIIDLLEEYGEDNDLPEGWWMEEGDIDDIILLIQFECN